MNTDTKKESSEAQRKAGGRPSKDSKEKATFQAKTLLNEDEWTKLKLEYEAYQFGRSTTFSAFLKERLLNTSHKTGLPVRSRESALELLMMCNNWTLQLGGVTRDYNQVVKRINSLPCSQALLQELKQGETILQQVSESLQLIEKIKEQVEVWCLSQAPVSDPE